MKLLVLALTVALLFTAGESVTDSPLSKRNLCCRATSGPALSVSAQEHNHSRPVRKPKATPFTGLLPHSEKRV